MEFSFSRKEIIDNSDAGRERYYTCHCGKKFWRYQSLGGHKNAHKRGNQALGGHKNAHKRGKQLTRKQWTVPTHLQRSSGSTRRNVGSLVNKPSSISLDPLQSQAIMPSLPTGLNEGPGMRMVPQFDHDMFFTSSMGNRPNFHHVLSDAQLKSTLIRSNMIGKANMFYRFQNLEQPLVIDTELSLFNYETSLTKDDDKGIDLSLHL